MKVLDCRRLACPEPVILTKKMIEESPGATFQVITDNGAARENIIRFCTTKMCTATEEVNDDHTIITISSKSDFPGVQLPYLTSFSSTILVSSNIIGAGDDKLGNLLMKNFICTLIDLPKVPEFIFFLNSGVRLTTEGSELLEPLNKLAAMGVQIRSCGICLDYYCLRDKLAAGEVTNMYTIAETLLASRNALWL